MWNPLRLFATDGVEPEIQNAGETYTLGDDAVLQAFYGALSRISTSGVRVSQENAVRCVAVLACLIVRAETFSALPVDVLQGEAGDALRRHDHAAYRLLAIAPNDLMTGRELWRWKQIREDTAGNAYVRIEWGKAYKPAALHPLTGQNPQLIVDRRTRRAAYHYTGDDFTPADSYAPRDILHFKGAVLRSPLEGASLIDLASESIGVAIGSEQFFARLLGNGSHFPGFLETDAVLTDEDLAAVADQVKGYAGLFNAGELRIFDRGLKYKQNDMSLRDAQLVEQMRWQLQQICSVFRVPMAAVQDLTNGTYSNSEQQDVALGKHTIAPICVNSEAVLRARLFADEPDVYAKWNLDALLRGDYATRSTGDATLVRAGILTRNEARGHYDLNRIDGLDEPLSELNLGVVSSDGTITGPDTGAPTEDAAGAAGDASPAAAILAPLRAEAVDLILARAAADSLRGRRTDETVAHAVRKLGPLAAAHLAAGVPFDRYGFVLDALASAPAEDPLHEVAGAIGEAARALQAAADAPPAPVVVEPAPPAPITVEIKPAERIRRETHFVTNEAGKITGKIETEGPDNG